MIGNYEAQLIIHKKNICMKHFDEFLSIRFNGQVSKSNLAIPLEY